MSASDTYPVPTFRFLLRLGEEQAKASSVSGLDAQYNASEYRDGMGGLFRLNGHQALASVTLSRVLIPSGGRLVEWLLSSSGNQIEKKDVTISLTNESGDEPFITWTLVNAFPTSMAGPDLDAATNEVVLRQVTLLAERLTVQAR